MRRFQGNYLICLAAVLAEPLSGQTPNPQLESIARQGASVATMEQSVARQREAVKKQIKPAVGGSFFLLPRATSMGTDSAPAVSVAAAPPALPCDPLAPAEVDAMVGQAAEREGLSPDLLRNVMKQESAFRPCAVSPKGAMGLMQLMPATAEQFGVDDPFDPSSNLDAGARFLKELVSRYGGDISKALGAYNAGPARVDAAGGVPKIPETVDYVKQILTLMPGK